MKTVIVSLIIVFLTVLTPLGADAKFQHNFEKAELGSLPDDFLVIEGQFTVREEAGNKFLEHPGTPLDSFGVLFGPNLKDNVGISARIFATSKGRRFPAFDVGLNGLGGYKLRVAPGKKLLELYRGDALKKSFALDWKGGKWTHLKLQVVKRSDAEWLVEGRIWVEGASEPKEPTITFIDNEAPPSGRASVSAMPYSGTPIRFDDLLVSEVAK
jgi:hypothetical protein